MLDEQLRVQALSALVDLDRDRADAMTVARDLIQTGAQLGIRADPAQVAQWKEFYRKSYACPV